MMFNKWSLTWRLTVLIMAGVGTILTAVIGYSYFSAKQLLEEEMMREAQHVAATVTSRIEVSSRRVEGMAQGLAAVMEVMPVSTEQSYQLMEKFLQGQEDVFGTAVALPATKNHPAGIGAYLYRTYGGLQKLSLGPAQAYETKDWYLIPVEMKSAVWSEPYFDEGISNVLMATYSAPVFSASDPETVRGVVTGDMSLTILSGLLDSLELGRENYAFIISGQGRFIAHPTGGYVMRESIFSVAEGLQDSGLHELGQKMIQGQKGYVSHTSKVNGKTGWVMYMPIPSTGWSLGIFFSRDELMARVFDLSRTQWYLGIGGFLLLCFVVLGIARSITRPLRQLEQATQKLAAGNFEATIPAISGRDEVARLAEAFMIMISELKIYMEMMQATVAAKERIASELRIASSIQMGLVPKEFPPFPERTDFELFALLEPAREVGGDFYDFFFLDEETETLYLVIGDVSDKGIGAALFMAIARTLLRSLVREKREPGELLSRLNDELSRNNESCMFVTLFCGAVHLPSGVCRYASGGHCPPMLLKTTGQLVYLNQAKGPVIGGMEGMTYTEGSCLLEADDMLLLYTDGVTEAANKDEELFGEARLEAALCNRREAAPDVLLREVREELHEFAAGAEQSDDITMLAFRYWGFSKVLK